MHEQMGKGPFQRRFAIRIFSLDNARLRPQGNSYLKNKRITQINL